MQHRYVQNTRSPAIEFHVLKISFYFGAIICLRKWIKYSGIQGQFVLPDHHATNNHPQPLLAALSIVAHMYTIQYTPRSSLQTRMETFARLPTPSWQHARPKSYGQAPTQPRLKRPSTDSKILLMLNMNWVHYINFTPYFSMYYLYIANHYY
jgi:hypothetical protein